MYAFLQAVLYDAFTVIFTLRLMYWTDVNSANHGRINKASMDGFGNVTVISEGETPFTAISIDYYLQRIYWSNGSQIACNANGSNNIFTHRSVCTITSILPLNDGNLFYACENGYFGKIFENGSLSSTYVTFQCYLHLYQFKAIGPDLQVVNGENNLY